MAVGFRCSWPTRGWPGRAEDELLALNAELEGRVKTRTAALEAANREMEAFSYSVSHDLRAPLRSIDAFSQILLREHAAGLDPEARRVLDIVVHNAQHMGQLIDDLLTLSRIGRKNLDRTPVDMEPLVRSVVEELQAIRKQGGLTATPGTASNSETATDGLVVYYFHGNTRCAACQALDDILLARSHRWLSGRMRPRWMPT